MRPVGSGTAVHELAHERRGERSAERAEGDIDSAVERGFARDRQRRIPDRTRRLTVGA